MGENSRAGTVPTGRRLNVGPSLVPILLLVLASGCETVRMAKITSLVRTGAEARILIMPPDVELATITAGGLIEPNAEWTKAALRHMKTAIGEEMRSRRAKIVDYVESSEPSPSDADERQLIKLHGVVGRSILARRFRPQIALPTKRKLATIDWSLGPAVRRLRDRYDANYALFIFVRDRYATQGRAAVMVLTAILTLGRAIPGGGHQIGFASLVDLEQGDIVWFNPLARGAGDLRTEEPARETVKTLLTGLPR